MNQVTLRELEPLYRVLLIGNSTGIEASSRTFTNLLAKENFRVMGSGSKSRSQLHELCCQVTFNKCLGLKAA
tara:strand:- start:241 stop:456 length:216 start_codon:yes stop_codon:yes gene_type:complete